MNDPDLLEIIRLARKFFPECKPYVSQDQGLWWFEFIGGMTDSGQGGYDASYDCWKAKKDFPLKENSGEPISKLGLFDHPYPKAFSEILRITGFEPSGRTLIVPDSFGPTSRLEPSEIPIVCAFEKVTERLQEGLQCLWNGVNDTMLIFESGEAFIVDHDLRLWWAKSRIRNFVSTN